MLQAMNTGHEGSLTTIHANTPRDALHRLEMLTLMAGVELPLHAIREQIASAFDLVLHLVRLVDGSRRLSRITEVAGMEGDVVTMQDIFVARADDDDPFARSSRYALLGPLRPTGLVPGFLVKLATQGVDVPSRLFETGQG
jgi:pilus assembly protein CpaF